MSGSEVESVNGSNNATDNEEVLEFMCRLCKQTCTAAEMDSHRAMHRREKRKRVPSPDRSEAITLFQQIVLETSPPPNIPVSAEMERRTAAAELAKKKAERREKSGKRRSKKHYNHDIEWETSSGS